MHLIYWFMASLTHLRCRVTVIRFFGTCRSERASGKKRRPLPRK